MNGDDLISKQDLLEQTGVSYGQFYRWKRMGLIPESWFIHKSTFTGQATFLPRQKVLERIERITGLKEEYSLDEIAELLSPDLTATTYTDPDVGAMDWLSDSAIAAYERLRPGSGPLTFTELVCIAAADRLLKTGTASGEQVDLAVRNLADALSTSDSPSRERHLTVLTRRGVSYSVFYSGACLFDADSKVIADLDVDAVQADLKVKLSSTEPMVAEPIVKKESWTPAPRKEGTPPSPEAAL